MRRLAASRLAGWTFATVVAGIVLLAAGCGSGGGASSASTPSPAATGATGTSQPSSLICQDVDALRTSLANLTHVKVGNGAGSALTAKVKDVQAKLTTLAGDAGSQWDAQVSGLKTALSALQTAVTGLGSGTSSLTNVVTTLGGVTTAAQDLLTAAGTRCPSPSPSPST